MYHVSAKGVGERMINVHYYYYIIIIIINEQRGRNQNIVVTECIVCISGHDPLIFSFLSFSCLIGWEFYGPNYLKY